MGLLHCGCWQVETEAALTQPNHPVETLKQIRAVEAE
jgi:hypothetical protein